MTPETHLRVGETDTEAWRVVAVVAGSVVVGSDFADYASANRSAVTVGAPLTDPDTVHVIPAHTCPRCAGGIPNSTDRGQYPGALSRRHRFVEICSDCGTAEAFHDYFGTTDLEPAWWIVGGQS